MLTVESLFSHHLDTRLHTPQVWSIYVPTRLKELLWKDMTNSLPLGTTWHGSMQLGRTCRCGAPVSLNHIWTSCTKYNMLPLHQTLRNHISTITSTTMLSWTEDPLQWPDNPWFPLLALRTLERHPCVSKKAAKKLKQTRPECKWAISTYLWHVWTARMREAHNKAELYILALHKASLKKALSIDPSLRLP